MRARRPSSGANTSAKRWSAWVLARSRRDSAVFQRTRQRRRQPRRAFLAEYVVAASRLVLPVYRLRYNPNVDQSMKGDDVLAFDLDSNPVRLVVGEAKFRGISSAAAVTEMVEGLLRSHKGGVPASLQFVADRLFDEGQANLGKRILECALLFVRGKLRLEYIGLLVSDTQAASRIDACTPATPTRLAMISLSVDDPDGLVESCYQKLE